MARKHKPEEIIGKLREAEIVLAQGGVPMKRIARIEGVADTEPLVADNPADPRNRRISLLLLDGAKKGGGAGGPIVKRPAPVAPARTQEP